MIFPTKPSHRELIFGGIYLFLSQFVVPLVLGLLVLLFKLPLTSGQINFVYFCINFAAVTVIFRKFLLASLRDTMKDPLQVIWYAVLGYLGNILLSGFVNGFCFSLDPDFFNVNDGTFAAMMQQDFVLVAIGTCLLVPVAEEVLYRGLLFRSLYDRSPVAAYLVSMLLFAAIHVVGYIGHYEPLHLLLCFLQYLPAGYCLAFAYRQSGTIAAPILMHMLTNIIATFAMR